MASEGPHAGHGSEHRFDFLGDRLCLDFVNTVSGMRLGAPIERLVHYADLVSWGVQKGVLSEAEGKRLASEAGRNPAAAERVLARATALREALFRLFTAVVEQRAGAPEDLKLLNDALSQALSHRRVWAGGEGLVLGWEEGTVLDRMLWPVVEDAANLLSSAERARVKLCEATSTDGCGWLFYDVTKGGTRRWCSMKDCGNRAKARRHYAKAKGRE